jgi:hypothetical protein
MMVIRGATLGGTIMGMWQDCTDLSEERRREAFLTLVQAQDGGSSVLQSRADVARWFHIPVKQVRKIEREGIENGWPPL